jgi:LPXTG-motif cell wall-anchored protein
MKKLIKFLGLSIAGILTLGVAMPAILTSAEVYAATKDDCKDKCIYEVRYELFTRLPGTSWGTTAIKNVKNGDLINVKLFLTNTGNIDISTGFHVTAPAGVEYVKGSTAARVNNDYTFMLPDGIVGPTPGIPAAALQGGKNQTQEIVFNLRVTNITALAKNPTLSATLHLGEGCKQTLTQDLVPKETEKPEECKPGIPVGDPRCDEKPEECKPGIPVGDPRCDEKPKPEECKPGIPVGDPRCDEKPTPKPDPKPADQLPKTGPASVVGSIMGAASLATAGSYYLASRRKF